MSTNLETQIFVQPNFSCLAYDFYIQCNGAWAQTMTCIQVPEGSLPPMALQLHRNQAQALMDRLWQAGLRPAEGTGSAGALAATERHLKDMRSLVFKIDGGNNDV